MTVKRLLSVELLVLAGYEMAEASMLDAVVVSRLRRMRMKRLGTVSELVALVDGSVCDDPGRPGRATSQDTALALLRRAEERAASTYAATLSAGRMSAQREAFALRIADAQRAIDWFDRLAVSIGVAPLA
ncbi:MAG: hypothetical protein JWN44_4672 [Myxococcales bacterium]|nr:hypothetical protein [Myxococcales bacterium]